KTRTQVMQYKCDAQFTKVPPDATVGILAARINALMTQLQAEHTKLERTSSGSQTVLVVGTTSGSSSGGTTLGSYAGKSVDLTAGTHTVSFGKTFSVPFIYGVLSCIGTFDGKKIGIGYSIDSVTNSDMTVTVEADCTLHHFEIPTT
ncbi:MAG: hypothetical protein ABIH23_00525, partial [bacterium]